MERKGGAVDVAGGGEGDRRPWWAVSKRKKKAGENSKN